MAFTYTCPQCGNWLRLRQRVVLSTRRCSVCGRPITLQEIDHQHAIAHQHELAQIDQNQQRQKQNAFIALAGMIGLIAVVLVVCGGCLFLPLLSRKDKEQAKVVMRERTIEPPAKKYEIPAEPIKQKPLPTVSPVEVPPATTKPSPPPEFPPATVPTTLPTKPKPRLMVKIAPKSGSNVILADNRIAYDAYISKDATTESKFLLVKIGRIRLLSKEIEVEKVRRADSFTYVKTDSDTPDEKTWIVETQYLVEK